MQINVRIDAKALKANTAKEIKNLAYSTSQALNATTKDAQQAERVHMDRTFHLRRTGFMYRLIKIFTFSNVRQGTPFTEIGIDNTKERLLLGEFEKGGPREPFMGKNVAVPITGTKARPSIMATIANRFTFKGMNLQQHQTSGGKEQWKGANRTFLIPGKGVFQRTGRKQKKADRRQKEAFTGAKGRVLRDTKVVAMLYKLLPPSSIKSIPPSLHFLQTVQQTVQQRFTQYFNRFFYRK